MLVKFQLDYILGFPDPQDAIDALDSLPADMEAAYIEIFDRIEKGKVMSVAIKVLSWLYYACRQLTMNELQEAISIRVGQTKISNLLVDQNLIIQYCHGLVTMDEETQTVRFTHYTVQEFLEKKFQAKLLTKVDIAKLCLTRFTFDDFAVTPYAFVRFEIKSPAFSSYALRFWAPHVRGEPEEDDEVFEILSKVLESPTMRVILYWIPDVDDYIMWDHRRREWRLAVEELKKLATGSVSLLHVIARAGLTILGHKVENFPKEVLKCKNQIENLPAGTIELKLLDVDANIDLRDTFDRSPLHAAVRSGYNDIVMVLLRRGAHVMAVDCDGLTPLHQAVFYGHKNIVLSLLQNGADVEARDKKGKTPLHLAARRGYQDVLVILSQHKASVDIKANDGSTALHAAADGWRTKNVIEVLLNLGVDIDARTNNGDTALHCAMHKGYKDIVDALLEGGANFKARNMEGATPLHYAAHKCEMDVIMALMERGADVETCDRNGETALHRAARNWRPDITPGLVAIGADISAKREDGSTPLHCAAEYGSARVIQALIQLGADISARRADGSTPLHCATSSLAVDVLIQLGADISARRVDGSTPLHCAAKDGNGPVVRDLIRLGADLEAQDNEEKTALDRAIENEKRWVMELPKPIANEV